jgi:hypothetical protein
MRESKREKYAKERASEKERGREGKREISVFHDGG